MYLHNINYRVFRDYKYEINDFQCDTCMFTKKNIHKKIYEMIIFSY